MKKWLLVVCMIFLVVLVACSKEEQKEETAKEGVKVEKSSKDVSITLPAGLVTEDTIAEIEKDTNDKNSTTINEDGSATVVLTKAQHKELMKELQEGMQTYLNEITVSEDYASIKDASVSKKFDRYTLRVEPVQFESSLDALVILGIAMQGGLYQAFDGKSEEKVAFTIDIVDDETSETIQTIKFPEDFEDYLNSASENMDEMIPEDEKFEE